MTWVALLRGINVGAHHRIKMPALREALAAAGLPGAATYRQSGNVLLESGGDEGAVAEAVRAVIAEAFGFDVPVVVRSGGALAAVLALDPHAAVAEDPKLSSVAFLPAPLEADVVTELVGRDWGEERLTVDGRELYLWTPGGFQASKLAKAVGKPEAAGHATVRNSRTVRALHELVSSA